MGHFYFIRHGQTVWNVENKICGATDIPLTKHGISQAEAAGKKLLSLGIKADEILSSPLCRAKETARIKKKLDCSKAEFLELCEGLCVQIMHIGSYDDEPATIALMDEYIRQNGYENDFGINRLHHEIYLSDARKTAPEKLKTVIRHPVRKI